MASCRQGSDVSATARDQTKGTKKASLASASAYSNLSAEWGGPVALPLLPNQDERLLARGARN